VRDQLDLAHWQKLVWNIPFNGLGVAGVAGIEPLLVPHASPLTLKPIRPVLPTDELLADPRWLALVRELMAEVLAVCAMKGARLSADYADQEIAKTKLMGAYRASTLIDFERGQPLELESLFLEPLRQARAADVNTPRLEALCRVLTTLNPA